MQRPGMSRATVHTGLVQMIVQMFDIQLSGYRPALSSESPQNVCIFLYLVITLIISVNLLVI